MKILGICGSSRKRGNTASIIGRILEGAKSANEATETELIFLNDYDLKSCTGCEGCAKSFSCVIRDDYAKIIEKFDEADAIVIGSPTYWYNVTGQMKLFIDRCYSLISYPEGQRKIWTSKYQDLGKKVVTVAVCEQEEESMMGFTSQTLVMVMKDLDLELIREIKVLHYFEAGSVKGDADLLDDAFDMGRQLS
ncbi:MAG: flavodoxin family protein [Proteocatella sp.]